MLAAGSDPALSPAPNRMPLPWATPAMDLAVGRSAFQRLDRPTDFSRAIANSPQSTMRFAALHSWRIVKNAKCIMVLSFDLSATYGYEKSA